MNFRSFSPHIISRLYMRERTRALCMFSTSQVLVWRRRQAWNSCRAQFRFSCSSTLNKRGSLKIHIEIVASSTCVCMCVYLCVLYMRNLWKKDKLIYCNICRYYSLFVFFGVKNCWNFCEQNWFRLQIKKSTNCMTRIIIVSENTDFMR